MGGSQSRQLQPAFTIANTTLAIPAFFAGLAEALANLRRDGKETDETEFLYELFEVYDKIHGTKLHTEFQAAIEKAQREKKTQVDWTLLHQNMPGIEGKSYSATVAWIVNSLIDSADKMDKADIARLFHLVSKVCEWRASEMRRHGGGDPGHQHAFKLWKQVKDLLNEIMIQRNQKTDL